MLPSDITEAFVPMKLLKLSLLALAAALLALACGANNNTAPGTNAAANANRATAADGAPASSPTATPDELASARSTYNATCARCHKANGEGGVAELDPGEKPLKVPSFKEGHALKHTDAEYARQIANGGEGMPAFKKRLTEQQIKDLVRLIRRDFQGGAGASASNANAGGHH